MYAIRSYYVREQKLKLLLVKRAREPFADSWALPGGFVGIDEDLEACALRELEEETGVAGVYLEQLHTCGSPRRDPRERVISVAYYSVITSYSIHYTKLYDSAFAPG